MERKSEEWTEEMKRKSVVLKNTVEHLYEKGPGILWKEGEELVEIVEGYLSTVKDSLEEVESALNDLKGFLEG